MARAIFREVFIRQKKRSVRGRGGGGVRGQFPMETLDKVYMYPQVIGKIKKILPWL